MTPIQKKIVTDEQMRPVAVQIDYDSWLEIERRLGLEAPETGSSERPSLQELADEIGPHWRGGEGLEYQRRIREEWTRPWDPEAREDT